MEKLSIIVPCYNEEEALPIFYTEMNKVIEQNLKHLQIEYIFINDGSKDKTLNTIREMSQKDERVRYISFSRNFGKEAAMYAGLKECTGDFVTVIDVDLQDPPILLKEMYDILKQGEYDVVGTRRVTRKGEPPIRSFFAKIFYKLINSMSKVEMVDGARDYRLMTRQVVDVLIEMKEYNRYSKGLYSFVGFNTKWLEYENTERVAGETKWSFWGLFKYAIEAITSFSTVPLAISSFVGILFCLVAFILILVIIIKTMVFGDVTTGWPSMICVIFFVSGVQLFSLGIIGQYLSRTYLEVKNRPIYIIKETEKNRKERKDAKK